MAARAPVHGELLLHLGLLLVTARALRVARHLRIARLGIAHVAIAARDVRAGRGLHLRLVEVQAMRKARSEHAGRAALRVRLQRRALPFLPTSPLLSRSLRSRSRIL